MDLRGCLYFKCLFCTEADQVCGSFLAPHKIGCCGAEDAVDDVVDLIVVSLAYS